MKALATLLLLACACLPVAAQSADNNAAAASR